MQSPPDRSGHWPRPVSVIFRKLLNCFAGAAPLRRNVTIEDVGNAAAFLCSDLASGITGEITYVDAGFNTVGLTLPD